MDTKCSVRQILCKLIVCCLVLPGLGFYVLGELLTTSGCSCVGYTTTYQCTAAGNGVTKWRGDEFNCHHIGNQIRLRHEKFSDPDGTSVQCNRGEIVGQSLRVEGNNYSSQLTVHVTNELNGTIIECVYENLVTNEESVIGRTQLTLTTEPFPPPINVHLADAGQGYLLFSWSTVADSCTPLQYHINSTCGVCPNVTNVTSALCTIDDTISHDTNVCSFKIRSVVCGNITGRWSDTIHLTLKVPEPPVITGIQASYDANGLTELGVTYRESPKDLFNISSDIGGYVRNFTIVYNDSLTNLSCTPLTTSSLKSSLPLSCFPSLLLNNNITVSISAINRLGKGKENKTVIAATNEYVNLSASSKRITCKFVLEQERNDTRSCSASYGECGKVTQWKTVLGNLTESPTVVSIDLYSDTQEYCYEVTATINKLTVIMTGKYIQNSTNGDHGQLQPTIIILIIAVPLMTVVGLAIATIVVFGIYRKYHPLVVSTTGYHAIFELLDEPWQLLKILQGVKELNVSINDTKISGCTPDGTRKIYLRFDQNLSDELAERMKHQIDEQTTPTPGRRMMDSRVTTNSVQPIEIDEQETIDYRRTCLLSNGSFSKTYTYSRCLPPRPGALCSLIEGIKNKHGSYDRINITGIAGTPKGQGDTLICLRFVSDVKLPRNWRKDFDSITIC